MAKFASIVTRKKEENAPSIGTVLHNQRLYKNTKLLPNEFRKQNWHMTRVSNVNKTFKKWVEENEERYQKINNRKLRNDANRMESLAIVLSEEQVKKCDPKEIWERANKFKEWFEARYQTQVRTMDWHRDEGTVDSNGNAEINEHIHLEYDNVNFDGKMVRRLFTKHDKSLMQDKIAEIYKDIGFVRGIKNAKGKGRKGIPQKHYRGEAKQKANYAKVKDLKKEVARLRSLLTEQGSKREQYAELERLNRNLKEQIKAKNLTIDELQNRIRTLQNELLSQKNENQVLRGELDQKTAQIADFEQIRKENTVLKAFFKKYFKKTKKVISQSVTITSEDAEYEYDRIVATLDNIRKEPKIEVKVGNSMSKITCTPNVNAVLDDNVREIIDNYARRFGVEEEYEEVIVTKDEELITPTREELQELGIWTTPTPWM